MIVSFSARAIKLIKVDFIQNNWPEFCSMYNTVLVMINMKSCNSKLLDWMPDEYYVIHKILFTITQQYMTTDQRISLLMNGDDWMIKNKVLDININYTLYLTMKYCN